MNIMNTAKIQHVTDCIYVAEKKAVQTMLVTALQHGFQIDDLIKLAKKYQTSAAIMECNDDNCQINYANQDGYFTRRFGNNYQQASKFAESFDTWWYQ